MSMTVWCPVRAHPTCPTLAVLKDVTMPASTTSPSAPHRSLAGGMAALRILFGLVYLSNALAKLVGTANYDLGFYSFNLITTGSARAILNGASRNTIEPLRTIYQDFVLANWGFFQWFLTVTELAIAALLLLGVASRLAALIALGLIGPIWVMLWDAGQYLWQYPVELVPLLILAIVPAGRTAGLDSKLAARLGTHWPF